MVSLNPSLSTSFPSRFPNSFPHNGTVNSDATSQVLAMAFDILKVAVGALTNPGAQNSLGGLGSSPASLGMGTPLHGNALGPASLNAPALPASSPQTDGNGKQKVYVLHSGVNDPTDTASNKLKDQLTARGVPADRIIVLPNEFPSFQAQGGILENLNLYKQFSDPQSQASQSAYTKLESELQARGIDPKNADVTLIGHSAGGQVDLSLAAIDQNRDHSIDQIITLGSPTTTNDVPPNVKITSLVSPQDPVVNLAGGLLGRLASKLIVGTAISKTPKNLAANDRVIQTPGLDHSGYYQDPDTLNLIAQLATGQQQASNPQAGFSLLA